MPALQEDVLRLDVAVHDALLVRVLERIGDLARDPERVLDRELLLTVQSVAQRLPVHEGHHIEQEPARLSRVVQRQDVRVLQVCGRPDLGEKAFATQRGGEVRMEDLHRHAALVLEVQRQVDGRHPATAELALDAVAVDECGGERHGGVGQAVTGGGGPESGG